MAAREKSFRVYLHSIDVKACWCVDEGPGTPEQYFEALTILVPTMSVTDFEQCDADGKPRAWLMCTGFLHTYDKDAVIT